MDDSTEDKTLNKVGSVRCEKETGAKIIPRRQTDKNRSMQRHEQTETHTERQTNRHRKTDRQTDRQRDRHTETDRHRDIERDTKRQKY